MLAFSSAAGREHPAILFHDHRTKTMSAHTWLRFLAHLGSLHDDLDEIERVLNNWAGEFGWRQAPQSRPPRLRQKLRFAFQPFDSETGSAEPGRAIVEVRAGHESKGNTQCGPRTFCVDVQYRYVGAIGQPDRGRAYNDLAVRKGMGKLAAKLLAVVERGEHE